MGKKNINKNGIPIYFEHPILHQETGYCTIKDLQEINDIILLLRKNEPIKIGEEIKKREQDVYLINLEKLFIFVDEQYITGKEKSLDLYKSTLEEIAIAYQNWTEQNTDLSYSKDLFVKMIFNMKNYHSKSFLTVLFFLTIYHYLGKRDVLINWLDKKYGLVLFIQRLSNGINSIIGNTSPIFDKDIHLILEYSDTLQPQAQIEYLKNMKSHFKRPQYNSERKIINEELENLIIERYLPNQNTDNQNLAGVKDSDRFKYEYFAPYHNTWVLFKCTITDLITTIIYLMENNKLPVEPGKNYLENTIKYLHKYIYLQFSDSNLKRRYSELKKLNIPHTEKLTNEILDLIKPL